MTGCAPSSAAACPASTATVSALADIGITTNTDGTLVLDGGKLDKALAADSAAVGALFTSEQGYTSRLDDILDSYLSAGGIIQTRTNGIQSQIDDIGDRREVLDRRLAALEDRYTRQFNALDALVGQLTATSDYLTQQLATCRALGSRITVADQSATRSPFLASTDIKRNQKMNATAALQQYRGIGNQGAVMDCKSSPADSDAH